MVQVDLKVQAYIYTSKISRSCWKSWCKDHTFTCIVFKQPIQKWKVKVLVQNWKWRCKCSLAWISKHPNWMVHIKLLHLLRHGIKFMICAHTKAYVPPHVLLPGIRSRLPSTSSCLLTSKCSSNFCNRILECRKCNMILDEGNALLFLQEKKNQPAPEVGIFTFTMPQSEPLGPSHWNDNWFDLWFDVKNNCVGVFLKF